MNSTVGQCNNRINYLFRAELGSISLSHKTQRHHFNTLSTSSQRCGWRQAPQPSPCFLGNSLSGREQTVRHTMLLLCQRNREKTKKMICIVCSTTGTQKQRFGLSMQTKQKVTNTQQSINTMFFPVVLHTFMYPHNCISSLQQSDELGKTYFSIFLSILGTIYYPHKICFSYEM